MILIAAATEMELTSVKEQLKGHPNIDFLVTGIGMFACAVNTTKALHELKPELFIHVGIAGAYADRSYHIGDIVQINRVINPELGFQEKSGKLVSFFEDGLIDESSFPYEDGFIINQNQAPNLPSATAHCVFTSTGDIDTVKKRSLFGADIEDMESSAVFYSCKTAQVPFHCIRAISNMVTVRDKASWKINEAIAAYTEYLHSWLSSQK